MRFVISLYGPRHVRMLLPLLGSLKQSNPNERISVYWQEIPRETIGIFQALFSGVEFVETDIKLHSDVTQRISLKTTLWSFAAMRHPGETVCFLDSDTLVIRNIANLIDQHAFDVLITDQPGAFPINSGVLVARLTPRVQDFFMAWRDETQAILQTPSLYGQANSRDKPFGGADQMALHRMLQYEFGATRFSVRLESGEEVRVRSIPCAQLNETQSVPISDKTHIIHYKGGWQTILFGDGRFTPNRPRAASWEMYILYQRTMRTCIGQLKTVRPDIQNPWKQFGTIWPPYLHKRTLQEIPGVYAPYATLFWLVSLPSRALVFAKDRLSLRK